MRFPGIADPEQLKILTSAFENYCLASNIEPGTQAYDNAALHIIAMYNNGALDVPTGAEIAKHVIPEDTPSHGG